MASDITDLYHLILLAQDSPNRHIGGAASLEVAMMAVIPELAIMRPVRLDRAGKPHFSQQELKGLINALGKFLSLFPTLAVNKTPQAIA
jgi:hypothetical protein